MGSISKIMKKLGQPTEPADTAYSATSTAEPTQQSCCEPPVDTNPDGFVDVENCGREGTEESNFMPDPTLRSVVESDETVPWDPKKVDPAVITFHNRYASICEQYRSVRARLLSKNPTGNRQVIAITSSVPEEGKSVTSFNLAIAMAEGGEQRVLLADADFRRSSLARMLGTDPSPGLAEVFLGKAELHEVIRSTPYPNLKVIPAGRCGEHSYGELLAVPTIRPILTQIRNSFNYSFLDMPPVNTVSDVSMLAPMCDGALMVIEMGRTPEPTVQLAVKTLQTNNIDVLGSVLSRFSDRRKHYYDRYYGYYHRH